MMFCLLVLFSALFCFVFPPQEEASNGSEAKLPFALSASFKRFALCDRFVSIDNSNRGGALKPPALNIPSPPLGSLYGYWPPCSRLETEAQSGEGFCLGLQT